MAAKDSDAVAPAKKRRGRAATKAKPRPAGGRKKGRSEAQGENEGGDRGERQRSARGEVARKATEGEAPEGKLTRGNGAGANGRGDTGGDATAAAGEEVVDLGNYSRPNRDARNAAEKILGANPFVGLDVREIADAVARLVRLMLFNPRTVVREQLGLMREMAQVLLGNSGIAPEPDDRRFRHEIWQKSGYYRRLMQAFLAWRESLRNVVDEAPVSDEDRQRARFALMLFTEAFAPTNSLLGNPGALARLRETKGKSLFYGARNLVDDLINNGGMPRQVDESKFVVGANLACSPGAVVFRNEVLELIQYQPQSEKVYAQPVLLVPPQINKFYIVDLAPGRSFAEFAAKNGVQLFAISWRNPTAAQREWNLETYVNACKEAMDAALAVSGAERLNLISACAGGYTAATLLGHLAALGDNPVESATFMVTVLDNSSPTLLGMFASKSGIAMAIQRSRSKGVLDGSEMARVFSWLRPNDLVWGYVANNWIMGNPPPAFDILYWNADTTRLPAEFHADMLSLYLHNPLPKPGKLKLLGTAVDMRKVDCDAYVVAGITDHITPWKACYESVHVLGGDTEFILSSSGHVQCIVNPPDNPKARFFRGGEQSRNPDEWLATASEHQGSWWLHWLDWFERHGGERVPAPARLGSPALPVIGPAPGRYVHQR